MEQYGNPFLVEWYTLQRAECARRNIIQAIEPAAEQQLLDAGGQVRRSYGDYVYEEYWDCPWPTLLIVWPPHTLSVYLAPTGQEDDMTIFLAALLPMSQVELHLTYDYRPFFPGGPFEEFLTLRIAKERIFAATSAGKRGVSMDKQEAERLVRAIERTHVAWLQVDQIVFNQTRNTYELKCSYRGPAGWLGARAVWQTQWITSPREWIDLLTTHRETL